MLLIRSGRRLVKILVRRQTVLRQLMHDFLQSLQENAERLLKIKPGLLLDTFFLFSVPVLRYLDATSSKTDSATN
jgi:hypothetical protein